MHVHADPGAQPCTHKISRSLAGLRGPRRLAPLAAGAARPRAASPHVASLIAVVVLPKRQAAARVRAAHAAVPVAGGPRQPASAAYARRLGCLQGLVGLLLLLLLLWLVLSALGARGALCGAEVPAVSWVVQVLACAFGRRGICRRLGREQLLLKVRCRV